MTIGGTTKQEYMGMNFDQRPCGHHGGVVPTTGGSEMLNSCGHMSHMDLEGSESLEVRHREFGSEGCATTCPGFERSVYMGLQKLR